MLSYSSCCDFYKCPYMFQNREELYGYSNTAMTLGSNVDSMINVLLVKHIKDEVFQRKKQVELGISDMFMAMTNNGDLCELMNVPYFVKAWYSDFVRSGLEVIDVQKHFIIDDLDYHGYIDAVFSDGYNKFVIENKTTGRFYDSFMNNKRNSYQAVGYALSEETDLIKYNFFNTKNMSEYHTYSGKVTKEDVEDFISWVEFVKANQHLFVKNKEYCSLNNCLLKKEFCS